MTSTLKKIRENTRRRLPIAAYLLSGGLVIALAPTVSGCASDSGAKQQQTYADAAQNLYEGAQKNLEKKNYLDAINQFNTLRNRFPYSKYAPLAELRIGDAYFAQDSFATAVQQYRGFVQLHPTHPEVPYAEWRVAEAFYKLMPDDWWILPPAYERNLSKTRDAARELQRFVDRYPNSEYTAGAKKRLARSRRMLADYEMYVAKFYLDRDNPRAASMRLRYLLEHYSGLGLDPQALFLLARAYIELGEMPRATTALNDLITYHPTSDYADRARAYLERYGLKTPG